MVRTAKLGYYSVKKRGGRWYAGEGLVDVKEAFTVACSEAGIADFHFHDLHHTSDDTLRNAVEYAQNGRVTTASQTLKQPLMRVAVNT